MILIYTTDALVEYVSSNSNNVDFDLIIGPTGTNLEQLSLTFDCNNMLDLITMKS